MSRLEHGREEATYSSGPTDFAHETARILQQVRRFFSETRGPAPERGVPVARWRPASEISETDDALELVMELPGIRADALRVELRRGVLTVHARKPERAADEPDARRVLLAERTFGVCERSFIVSASVAAEQVAAHFADGVLTVRLPKRRDGERLRATYQSVRVTAGEPAGQLPAVTGCAWTPEPSARSTAAPSAA